MLYICGIFIPVADNTASVRYKSGVREDDFCFNDEHKHSKPLAGYIGAKMIYQSLFGVEPPALSEDCTVISQSAVDAKLAGHSAAPRVLISEKQLHVLK